MRTNAFIGFSGWIFMCLFATSVVADGNIKRLTSTGPDQSSTCETLGKQALSASEANPQSVKLGTCTCAPLIVKGSAPTFECVLYYTSK